MADALWVTPHDHDLPWPVLDTWGSESPRFMDPWVTTAVPSDGDGNRNGVWGFCFKLHLTISGFHFMLFAR